MPSHHRNLTNFLALLILASLASLRLGVLALMRLSRIVSSALIDLLAVYFVDVLTILTNMLGCLHASCRNFYPDVTGDFESVASSVPVKTIALGSDRTAKIMAVRASIARVAKIHKEWADARVVARAVTTTIPAMPLTDWELMQGARERALAVREVLSKKNLVADIYIGLEGGFHSISVEGEWHTFLRGWAYATDENRGHYGAAPAIGVPESIVKKVIEGRELGLVIDEVTGGRDVRNRRGAWGVLTRDLVTRSMSFEMALLAALAPFYNSPLYSTEE